MPSVTKPICENCQHFEVRAAEILAGLFSDPLSHCGGRRRG